MDLVVGVGGGLSVSLLMFVARGWVVVGRPPPTCSSPPPPDTHIILLLVLLAPKYPVRVVTVQ